MLITTGSTDALKESASNTKQTSLYYKIIFNTYLYSKVKRGELAHLVVALNSDVATLIEQRRDGLHALRRRIESRGASRRPAYLRWQDIQ